VFAAIAAAVDPNALSGGLGEFLDHSGGDCLLPRTFRHRLGAVGVGLGLVAYRLQTGDAFLQGRVVQIGDASLDGVIEPLQPQIRFSRPRVQYGDTLSAALSPLLTAVQLRG